MISFFVEGTPIPQGSKGATKGGRLFDTNAKVLKPWREKVTETALIVGHNFPKNQPVEVEARFIFERPKSVKRPHMSVKPDIDKLQRALFDGLTDANIWGDDSRVVRVHAWKEYGYPAGVWVTVKGIEE